jgi:hypothetical protein
LIKIKMRRSNKCERGVEIPRVMEREKLYEIIEK